MNLQNQISLLSNPQEFTRLCNAILEAEYGNDFLPIDDDRADNGNDGYVKSKELLVAMHCFKRVQNKSIDAAIKAKMVSDLRKAINLKTNGTWAIKEWLFLSNYPVSEAIGRDLHRIGKNAGIEVSWRGSDYLASVLQRANNVQAQFPNLETNEVIKKLEEIRLRLEENIKQENHYAFGRVAHTKSEANQIIEEKPPGWEYLLFGSILYLEKEKLSMKWQDFEIEYTSKSGSYLDAKEGLLYLFNKVSDLSSITENSMKVFTPEMQTMAFGKPGEPGNANRIIHMATRTVAAYEGLMDWAASLRSVSIPAALQDAYSAASRIARTPTNQFKDFIEKSIEQINRIPGHLNDSNPHKGALNIVLDLVLTIDDNDIKNYVKLAKKTKRKVGY